MTINTYIIEEHLSKGRLKELAFFIKMKQTFRNSCFYKFTLKGAARRSGLSVGRVRRFVNKFIKWGWCRWHHNNLIFIKLTGTVEAWVKTNYIKHEFNGNVKQIYEQLQLLILKMAEKQFRYLEKLQSDHNKNQCSAKRRKLARKLLTGRYIISDANSFFSISYKTIASKLRMSAASAYNLMMSLEGQIKVVIKRDKRIVQGPEKVEIALAEQDKEGKRWFLSKKGNHCDALVGIFCNRYFFC